MTPESSSNPSASEKGARKRERPGTDMDIAELEKRVHLAELRAREAEAEVRYLEASMKRRSLRGEKKDGAKRGKTGAKS